MAQPFTVRPQQFRGSGFRTIRDSWPGPISSILLSTSSTACFSRKAIWSVSRPQMIFAVSHIPAERADDVWWWAPLSKFVGRLLLVMHDKAIRTYLAPCSRTQGKIGLYAMSLTIALVLDRPTEYCLTLTLTQLKRTLLLIMNHDTPNACCLLRWEW